MLLRFALVLQKAMKFLLNIGSEVDIDATPILSAWLAYRMHKLTVASNINQADDNELFNDYNDDE